MNVRRLAGERAVLTVLVRIGCAAASALLALGTGIASSQPRASTAAPNADGAARGAIALEHLNIVSMADGSVRSNVTLLIEGTRVARVLDAAEAADIPPDTRRIDTAGRFAIPGLWDMHVHSFIHEQDADWMFPLFIAHGVTGVRDMGSLMSIARMRHVRAEIERGTRIGPRISFTGPLIDAAGADWIGTAGVPTANEAVHAVQQAAAQGADFFKVYPLIGDDAFRALVGEAKRLALPIAGQVPESVTVAQAASAGQRSIEHMEKLLLACSGIEDEVVRGRRAVLAQSRTPGELLDRLSADAERTVRLLDKVGFGACRPVVAALVRHQTHVTPTLMATNAYLNELRRPDDPRLAWLPRNLRETWAAMDLALRAAPPAQGEMARTIARLSTRALAALADGGVPLLAGTHTAPILPFVFPGSSLHDELEAFVKAGVSSLHALQSATITPARFLGHAHEAGEIAPGYWADLVVLDGDPLRDIARLRSVFAVVVNGRFLDRPRIDALLRRNPHAE